MSDTLNNNDNNLISRRSMLQTTAGVAAAGMAPAAWGAPRRFSRSAGAANSARSSVGVFRPVRPSTRAENQLATELAERMKQEIMLAIENPSARFPAGSFAAIAQTEFRSNAKLLARLRKSATRLRRGVSSRPTLGKAASTSLDAGVRDLALHARVKRSIMGKSPQVPVLKPAPIPKFKKKKHAPGLGNLGDARFRKLGFFLESVKCYGETSDGGDSDEILLGGFGVSPDGTKKKISQWKVSNDFDKGETVTYEYPKWLNKGKAIPAPRRMVEFDLGAGGEKWPKPYVLTLIMGEEDFGGFAKILNDYGMIAAKVIGKAVGYFFGDEVGAFVEKVLGLVFGWLASLFRDDLIDRVTWILWLADRKAKYFSSLNGMKLETGGYYSLSSVLKLHKAPTGFRSPTGTMTFKGDGGGHYKARIFWKVSM